MARILVTGGAGFVGSHIVDELLETHHEVHVIDNLSSGSLDNLSLSARFHEGDIRDSGMVKLLRDIDPDIIVHCAAQMSVRISMEDPRLDTDINVLGLVNMLQHYTQKGFKMPFFVFLSTGGAIYGEQETFPATEEHPTQPECVYGLAKKVGEQYLDLWKRQFGMPYAALRLSNVFGPRQSPHGEAGVVAIFAEKLLGGEVPVINGSGEQTRDFVYVKDVARAVGLVVGQRAEGIFNIGTGKETSINTLYSHLTSALRVDVPPRHGEGKIGEQLRSVIDASLAKRIFQWQPEVSLQEGLRYAVQYFREHRESE